MDNNTTHSPISSNKMTRIKEQANTSQFTQVFNKNFDKLSKAVDLNIISSYQIAQILDLMYQIHHHGYMEGYEEAISYSIVTK